MKIFVQPFGGLRQWLQNFAYRIEIGSAVFIVSMVVTMLISLIVISFHMVELSRVNPAELIRYE